MKKTIRTLMMALVIFTATSMHAADGLELKINDQQDLVVKAQNVEKGAVLSLIDNSGEVLFKDCFFDGESYAKVLNFNALPDGVYTLSFDKQFGISNTTIIKKGTSIQIDKNASEFIFKPNYEVNGKKVSFQLTNPKEKTVYLEVFDKRGAQVASLKSNNTVLKKTFDFSEVPAGTYTVRIKFGNNNFIKDIEIG